MGRTNNVAQSDRSSAGKENQRLVFRQFTSLLERTGLDKEIELKAELRQPMRVEEWGNEWAEHPDITFIHPHSNSCLGFVGCKLSLRERWKQDFLAAIILKKLHPGSFWIEQFARETEGDKALKIERNVAEIKRKVGNVFDLIYSTSIGHLKDQADEFVARRLNESLRILRKYDNARC